MKIKYFVVPALILISSNSVRAEDDLMQILEGKSKASETAFVENEEIGKIKKSLGITTAEQNIFFQFLSEKKYEKALFQFASAFDQSSFRSTPTGIALESFLKFKNNLIVTGVETLMLIKDPQNINSAVTSLWKENLNSKNSVWDSVQIVWNPFWTPIFGEEAEMATLLNKNYISVEVSELTDHIKRTQPDSKERSVLQWQLVLNLALRGDSTKAAQVLSNLMKAKNNPINSDLMTLTAGRLLYQNGFLDAAVKYYKKISKKSDYWFVAQEEMAWAYMRKGEPQNAIAQTKTLIYPMFKGFVGIESYLLDAFVRLKVCDYPGVISTVKAIKPQFADHLLAIEKLVQEPRQPASETLAKALIEGPVSIDKLGKAAHMLPMASSKDEVLNYLMKAQKVLDVEAQVAEQLFANSLTFGNLQGAFETLKNQIKTRAQLNQGSYYQRIQELAKVEFEDSKQVIQRLHIVEVEMIQQVEAASKIMGKIGSGEFKKGTTGADGKYTMSYLIDKEVWFDELSNFNVDIKNGCAK